MRSSIIITVTDRKNTFTYDVEVPVSISAQKASADIVAVLNSYKGGMPLIPNGNYLLKNERTQKTLTPEKTLYENGVWQGDTLTIMNML